MPTFARSNDFYLDVGVKLRVFVEIDRNDPERAVRRLCEEEANTIAENLRNMWKNLEGTSHDFEG